MIDRYKFRAVSEVHFVSIWIPVYRDFFQKNESSFSRKIGVTSFAYLYLLAANSFSAVRKKIEAKTFHLGSSILWQILQLLPSQCWRYVMKLDVGVASAAAALCFAEKIACIG